MDFPQFFRTAISQSTILSNRWRGLALLCKRSDTLRSARGVLEDQVMPATGTEFSDRDIGFHVIQKPMKTATVIPTTTGATLIDAPPGMRVLIHSYSMNLVTTAIETTTFIGLRYTQDGALTYAARLFPVPLVAQSIFISGVAGVLGDPGSGVSAIVGTANPATSICTISYSLVGAS